MGGLEKQFLPDVVPCLLEKTQEFILFAQRDKIQRLDLFTAVIDELPISGLESVVGLDIDKENSCVFWSDSQLHKIGKQCLKDGKVSEILVSSNISSVEEIAYDWIARNLYFVDGVRAVIEIMRTDLFHLRNIRKIILSPPILKRPRGIAVHPVAGYLFWTDWSAENPSVNRSTLDGSNIKQLFKEPVVYWPNGITIDYIAERIYWVDARMDYIGSSDLHGKKFKKIIEKNLFVQHPFSVAVFKDIVYWSDWSINSILRADKDDGTAISGLVNQLSSLMDIKVYAHGIQIGSNPCSNVSCQYICIAKPAQEGYSCLCPDGMYPNPNGNRCLCPGNVEPHWNFTCPEVKRTCGVNSFTCGDNRCIPQIWHCDGDKDCVDGSDEVNCSGTTCGPNTFTCNDGNCVPYARKCNRIEDCTDGSDEFNCPKKVCC